MVYIKYEYHIFPVIMGLPDVAYNGKVATFNKLLRFMLLPEDQVLLLLKQFISDSISESEKGTLKRTLADGRLNFEFLNQVINPFEELYEKHVLQNDGMIMIPYSSNMIDPQYTIMIDFLKHLQKKNITYIFEGAEEESLCVK